MTRIFITGSADGLGLHAAQGLIARGHKVTLHARNEQRAKDAMSACPNADGVLVGDLSSMAETQKLAEAANKQPPFDCIIHNAGIYRGGFLKTPEGLPSLIAINVIAPYILTCLTHKPQRLVFLSSDSHYSGSSAVDDVSWAQRGESKWSDSRAYGDSKLYNNLLANAFARRWPDVKSNCFHPGWVATKMGGKGAPDSFEDATQTYVLLAEGKGAGDATGKYFDPKGKLGRPNPSANDEKAQEKLIKACEEISGVRAPPV